jgi:hypothetical protein
VSEASGALQQEQIVPGYAGEDEIPPEIVDLEGAVRGREQRARRDHAARRRPGEHLAERGDAPAPAIRVGEEANGEQIIVGHGSVVEDVNRAEPCRRELDGRHDPPGLESDQKDPRVSELLARRDAVRPGGLLVVRSVAFWIGNSTEHVTSREAGRGPVSIRAPVEVISGIGRYLGEMWHPSHPPHPHPSHPPHPHPSHPRHPHPSHPQACAVRMPFKSPTLLFKSSIARCTSLRCRSRSFGEFTAVFMVFMVSPHMNT